MLNLGDILFWLHHPLVSFSYWTSQFDYLNGWFFVQDHTGQIPLSWPVLGCVIRIHPHPSPRNTYITHRVQQPQIHLSWSHWSYRSDREREGERGWEWHARMCVASTKGSGMEWGAAQCPCHSWRSLYRTHAKTNHVIKWMRAEQS